MEFSEIKEMHVWVQHSLGSLTPVLVCSITSSFDASSDSILVHIDMEQCTWFWDSSIRLQPYAQLFKSSGHVFENSTFWSFLEVQVSVQKCRVAGDLGHVDSVNFQAEHSKLHFRFEASQWTLFSGSFKHFKLSTDSCDANIDLLEGNSIQYSGSCAAGARFLSVTQGTLYIEAIHSAWKSILQNSYVQHWESTWRNLLETTSNLEGHLHSEMPPWFEVSAEQTRFLCEDVKEAFIARPFEPADSSLYGLDKVSCSNVELSLRVNVPQNLAHQLEQPEILLLARGLEFQYKMLPSDLASSNLFLNMTDFQIVNVSDAHHVPLLQVKNEFERNVKMQWKSMGSQHVIYAAFAPVQYNAGLNFARICELLVDSTLPAPQPSSLMTLHLAPIDVIELPIDNQEGACVQNSVGLNSHSFSAVSMCASSWTALGSALLHSWSHDIHVKKSSSYDNDFK